MRLFQPVRTTWRRTVATTLTAASLLGSTAFGQAVGEGRKGTSGEPKASNVKAANPSTDQGASNPAKKGTASGEPVAGEINDAVGKAAEKVDQAKAVAAEKVDQAKTVASEKINQAKAVAAEKIDTAKAAVGAAVDSVPNRSLAAVAEVRAKLITDIEGFEKSISQLADYADATVKKRLDPVQKQLNDVKQRLRGTSDETADQVRTQIREVREALEGVRKELDGVAEQTTGALRQNARGLTARMNETIVYLNPNIGATLLGLDDAVETTAEAAVIQAGQVVDSALDAAARRVNSINPSAANETAHKGRLGISVKSSVGGVMVSNVYAGGVAARVGLQPGDRIVKLNGKPIAEVDDLRTSLEAAAQGDNRATIEISRGGRPLTIEANFGSVEGTPRR
jgi:hypothetical protein